MDPVAVLVVSYRTPLVTLSAVRSALDIPGVQEVIVVDNDSRDQTADLLQGLEPDHVETIVNVTNVGFGTAANQAAKAATSPILIFLNSDAELTAGAAHELVDELQRHDGRSVVGARLVDPAGHVQRSAGLLPGPLDLVVRALGVGQFGGLISRFPMIGRIVRGARLSREYESAVTATASIDTNMVSGACFAIGREAFWELGGFDERFFLYFEDADLCRRAAMARIPIRYVPSAMVAHIGGASSSEDYHFGPRHGRSMRQYLGKWYGPVGSGLALILLWLRAVAFSISFRPTAKRAWRSVWAAMRDEDPRR